MNLLHYILLTIAFLCGTLIPVHAGMNAALSRGIGNPIFATIFSFCVSFICLIGLLSILRPNTPSMISLSTTPAWAWLAGVVGIIYVIGTMIIAPKLGASTFIATVIAGQMTMALIIDHFGLLGFEDKSINLERLVGIIFVIVGVIIIQAKNSN